MKRLHGFLVLCAVLVFLNQSISSQYIFVPWVGERPIEKVADVAPDDPLKKMGKPCGNYLLYEEIEDQQIVSLKVPLTKEEERQAVTSPVRTGINDLDIEIDDSKSIPTAEWKKDNFHRLIIRMSAKDFHAATCLATKKKPSGL